MANKPKIKTLPHVEGEFPAGLETDELLRGPDNKLYQIVAQSEMAPQYLGAAMKLRESIANNVENEGNPTAQPASSTGADPFTLAALKAGYAIQPYQLPGELSTNDPNFGAAVANRRAILNHLQGKKK